MLLLDQASTRQVNTDFSQTEEKKPRLWDQHRLEAAGVKHRK